MASLPIALPTGSNPARHGQEGATRLVNCYAEATEDAKHPFAIRACSGLTQLVDVSGAPNVRALFDMDSHMIGVLGRQIVRFDQGFAATTIGGIASDGLVAMARNRKTPDAQVGVVCDGVFNIVSGSTVTEVTDPDLPPPVSISALDGYFILPIADGRWFITSVDEGTEIDGLDFASAESNPDGLVRSAIRGRDAFLFGPKSFDVYQNTGGADFPFSRVTARNTGCYAAGSVEEMTIIRKGGAADDVIVWAGTNQEGSYAGVFVMSGYEPVKISNYEVDRLIESEASPENIRSFSWSEGGHSFYQITGTDWTRVWDGTENKWHDRKSYGLGRWRASAYCYFARTHVVGDYASGELYSMSRDVYDEAGTAMVCEVICAPSHAETGRIIWGRLDVDCVKGVGLVSTSSHLESPEIMLDYSEDGQTFGSERTLRVGQAGQSRARVFATRLGMTDKGLSRTYRLRWSAAVYRSIMALNAEATVGR